VVLDSITKGAIQRPLQQWEWRWLL
jgi:hypothetical protein